VSRRVLPVFLVALAGCGGAERAARPKPDRVAVQERVAAYVGSLLAGDGERACAQLTPEYRRLSDERAHLAGLGSCAEATALYGEAVEGVVPEGFAREAADPRRVIVTLRGRRADAAYAVGPRVTRTTLREVGGRWLIDGLGVR
jgi:hypothetical protein